MEPKSKSEMRRLKVQKGSMEIKDLFQSLHEENEMLRTKLERAEKEIETLRGSVETLLNKRTFLLKELGESLDIRNAYVKEIMKLRSDLAVAKEALEASRVE